jgi:hypothetical protein
MRPPQASLVSSFIIGGTILAALIRVGTSRPARVSPPATRAQVQELYSDIADKEPAERADSARRFRASPWSQDDDFHAKEMKRAKDFAKGHNVTITSVLDGLDRGMREHWPTPTSNVPNPKVMPCRPRLMY